MLRNHVIALGALFFALCNVGHAQELPYTYIVTDLGTLGGNSSYAYGINNNGQVVGSSATASGYSHAFLYSNGTMNDIGTLDGSSSWAYGINDNGQIVGSSGAGTQHAFLYNGDGPMQDISPVNANVSVALGINNAGYVVGGPGYLFPTAEMWGAGPAFIRNPDGSMQTIDTFGGSYNYASGINNSRQVVGSASNSGGQVHAFLYSNPGSMLDLGTLPNGSYSIASAINDSGLVVGWGGSDSGNGQHAFLYNGNGPVQDLGTLGGQHSWATSISNSGLVVGTAWTSAPAYHAFVYNGTSMQDLNNLIAPSSGWTLSQASDINDKGQIVGTGITATGQGHAFLLNPFTRFSQTDDHWGDDPYGTTGTYLIKDQGCALTSLAMVLDYAGVPQDPGTLNELMKMKTQVGSGYVGYTGDSVNWGPAVIAATDGAFQFKGSPISSTAELDKELSEGHLVVVGVNQNAEGASTHFVVVTAKQGETYTVVDPWSGSWSTLDSYNTFRLTGYVEKSADVSELDISVVAPGSGVNLLLTDFRGNKTGIDPNGYFQSIPESAHFTQAFGGLDFDESLTDLSQYIQARHPEYGDYGIEIRGIDAMLTPYTLFEKAFAPDGRLLWSREMSGVIGPDSVDRYSITYAVPEPSTITIFSIGVVCFLAFRRRRHAA